MIAGILRRMAAVLAVLLLLGPLAAAEEPQPVETREETTTPEPTREPTAEPTAAPPPEASPTFAEETTVAPTEGPTTEPTVEETVAPTAELTAEPTTGPTEKPADERLVMRQKSRRGSDLKLGELMYLDGGMRIPVLFQYDYTTVIATKGETRITVSAGGCGAAALSMAIAYLTDDTDQTPYTIMYEAVKDRIYRTGYGIGHGGMSKLARRHGLRARWVSANERTIREALEAGHPVIAHMGEGDFTDEGHYILLRGLDEDGRVCVNDPNSQENSEKTHSLWEIIEETKTGAPFMILSVPEEEPERSGGPTDIKKDDPSAQ